MYVEYAMAMSVTGWKGKKLSNCRTADDWSDTVIPAESRPDYRIHIPVA